MNISSNKSPRISMDPNMKKLKRKNTNDNEIINEFITPHLSNTQTGSFILNPKLEFKKMLKKQTMNRWYNPEMKNLKDRVKIIFGLMQKICKILELQISTFCLSVNIFDAIISKYPVESSQMVPLGIISVVLASKMNETHDKVITLSDISNYIIPLDVSYLAKMERKAFSVLGFQLNMVHPESFICFLLHQFLSDKFDFFGGKKDEDMTSRFLNIVNYLNLLTLIDYTFYKYTSVAVAVSILMYARRLCGLESEWPDFLMEFTGITPDHVTECIALIQHRYEEKFVMKIFQKIDVDNNDGAIEQNHFLNPKLVNEPSQKISEDFFMNNEAISKYMKSLKTMDSFKKTLHKC